MVFEIPKRLAAFGRDEKGVVLIYLALILFVLGGMTGLAVDVGFAYVNRQNMQSAADAAAFSGEAALVSNQTANNNIVTEGKAVAATDGFVDAQNSVTVTINHPPVLSTAYAGNTKAVEAVIQKQLSANFATLFGITTWNIKVHAVALLTDTNYCVLALNSSGTAIQLNGNITVGNPNCGLADDSTSNPATDFKGGSGTVNGPFSVAGNENTNGNNFTFNYANVQNAPPVADPYTNTSTAANGFTSENAWVMAQQQSPNVANISKTLSTGLTNVPSSCAKKNPVNIPPNAATPGTYCTVSAGTLSGSGSYYIYTVSGSPTLATLSGGGSYSINTVSGGTLNGSSPYYIDTVTGGTLGGSGSYYINTVSGGTLSGGTYYIGSVTGGTLGNGTYYISTVTGGTLSGGTYYIDSASGGTLSNGVFYINSLSGPVTATNATLVVFSSISAGNSAYSVTAPVTNTFGAANAGLGLVSPNAIPIEFDGNGSLQGAIYDPLGSVTMKGDVNSSCAQIIAGSIDLRGNVQLANNETCGLQDITSATQAKLVE